MYKYRFYLRGVQERWLRMLLRTLQSICSIWLEFVVFGLKVQEFLKSKLQRSSQQDFKEDEGTHHVERVIPKVKGMKIFGTLFDLRACGGAEKLHIYIDSRHYKFGDIFEEQFFGSSDAYIFVSSASLMRSVFLHEGQYPRHPLPDAWTLYNEHFNCRRGLLFMDGEEWFHNRRILNRFLLNGSVNWMDDHIKASTAKLIDEWKQQTALLNAKSSYVVPDLEKRLFRWAVDVICTIMFGQIADDCPKLDVKLEIFSEIVQKVFEKSTALMNFPAKWAKLLRLRIWREFEQNVEKVLRMGSEIIDMFVALNGTDHVTTALPASDESETLFNLLKHAKMPLQMIKRVFVDLVIAAGDTTAYSSVWALFLSGQDITLQKKLAKDILLHAEMSPLVRGLIKETLRLYPVAPFIGRYMASDAVVDGYYIPKDTLVLLSLYTAGRDEKHFPQPLQIKPERWLRDPTTGEFTAVLQAHGSLPFAIGNRSCIGRKIAYKQMQCLLSQMISNFHLSLGKRVVIEPILRMVTVPDKPITLELRSR